MGFTFQQQANRSAERRSAQGRESVPSPEIGTTTSSRFSRDSGRASLRL